MGVRTQIGAAIVCAERVTDSGAYSASIGRSTLECVALEGDVACLLFGRVPKLD